MARMLRAVYTARLRSVTRKMQSTRASNIASLALLKTIPELRPVHRRMPGGRDNMFSFQVECSFLFSFVIKTKLINPLSPHTNTRAHAQSHAHSCRRQTHALTHAHSSLTHKHRRFRCSCSLRIVFLSNGTAVLQRK